MRNFIKRTDEWSDNHPYITGVIEFMFLVAVFGAGWLALVIL